MSEKVSTSRNYFVKRTFPVKFSIFIIQSKYDTVDIIKLIL